MKEVLEFIIRGETPAKKNSRINLRNGVSIPSKRYREWHQLAITQIYDSIKPIQPINNPVKINLTFTHGDLRRRDSDNGCSSIMDLLVDAKILVDDNWQIVQDIAITNKYEKGNPSCKVYIQAL